jgi:hypothetical protein
VGALQEGAAFVNPHLSNTSLSDFSPVLGAPKVNRIDPTESSVDIHPKGTPLEVFLLSGSSALPHATLPGQEVPYD